jgi:hypothetical protein
MTSAQAADCRHCPTPIWRPQYTRDAIVLAVLHGEAASHARATVDPLESAAPQFRQWDGRLAVSGGREAAPGDATVPAGVGEVPAIIVADRFGQIYHSEYGGADHALSEPRELESWLRFIGTQCPE